MGANGNSLIIQTFDPPPTCPLGEGDGLYPGGSLHYVRTVNAAMIEAAPDHVAFIDSEVLAMRSGIDWFDDRLYRLAKQPFAMEAAVYSECACRRRHEHAWPFTESNNRRLGQYFKWGGVVGDEGLTGIASAPKPLKANLSSLFRST